MLCTIWSNLAVKYNQYLLAFGEINLLSACFFTPMLSLAISDVYTHEFHFCEKVKEKLEHDAYQEFLKCLHIYSQEIITRSELKNLVGFLFIHSFIHSLTCLARYLIFSYFYLVPARVNLTKGES